MAMRLTLPQMDLRASWSFLALLHWPMPEKPRFLRTQGSDRDRTTTFRAPEMKNGSVSDKI